MIEIEVGNYYVLKVDEDITYITVKPSVYVETHMVKEVIEVQKEVQKGKASLVILDVSKASGITKEARNYTSGKDVEGLQIAMAIIVSSLPMRILANFFIKFDKPPAPTKMFNSERDAIGWLNTFR